MCNNKRRLIFLIAARVLWASVFSLSSFKLSAESSQKNSLAVWEGTFGNDELMYLDAVMAISPESEKIFISARSSLAGTPQQSPNHWLLIINHDGKKNQEIQLFGNPEAKKVSESVLVRPSVLALNNGQTLLVTKFRTLPLSIEKLATSGEVLLEKPLAEAKTQIEPSQIAQLVDNHFLLVGHKGGRGVVIKFNDKGEKGWEKTIDRSMTTYITSCLPATDGSFVLVETSGGFNQVGKGVFEVWISKHDAEGGMQREIKFQGRNGVVCSAGDTGYVVIYDKENAPMKQNIHVKRITADFTETWDVPIITANPGVYPFRIVPGLDGGFIVAGAKDFKLWAARLDRDGKVSEISLNTLKNQLMGCFDLISAKDHLFIMGSVYSENKKKQMNSKIGLIKISLK